MTKRLLIVALDHTVRDLVVEHTLKGSRKQLPRITHAKLPRLDDVKTLAALKTKRKKFSKEFDRLLESKKNLIISGNLVNETRLGIVPLFEGGFPSQLRPDLIVLLETETRDMIVIPGQGVAQRKNLPKVHSAKLQQDMNRQLSTLSGSPMQIFQLERGNIKKTLKEFRRVLLRVMK